MLDSAQVLALLSRQRKVSNGEKGGQTVDVSIMERRVAVSSTRIHIQLTHALQHVKPNGGHHPRI